MLLYSLLWWLYHFMSSENKVKKCFKIVSLSLSLLASGCGSVGKAVNSNTRGPRFKSSHQQKLCIAHLLSAVLKKFSLSLSLLCVFALFLNCKCYFVHFLFHCQDSKREPAKVVQRYDVWHSAKIMETAKYCHPGR